VIGMVLGLTSMTYAWGSYMTTYSATYGGLDPRWGSLSQVTSQLTAMIVSVFFGLLTDKIGRKPCLLISGIGLAVGTPIAFSFINDHPLPLFIMRAVALALVALLTVTATPTFAELFPKRVRASGVGFPYALTVGLIGGTIPLVGTLLKDLKLPSAFPFYLAGLAGISAITYATLKNRDHPSGEVAPLLDRRKRKECPCRTTTVHRTPGSARSSGSRRASSNWTPRTSAWETLAAKRKRPTTRGRCSGRSGWNAASSNPIEAART